MRRKGLSPIFEAIFLVVIAVSMSTLIAGWLSGLSTSQSNFIKNSTETNLQCQFNNMMIKSATYNCNHNCAAGTSHTTAVVVANTGRGSLTVNNIYIQNTTGTIFALTFNQTTIPTSSSITLTNISTATCNGINGTTKKIIVNSLECPGTAFDSLNSGDITFLNC